jgi:sensor histidine kinase YesM
MNKYNLLKIIGLVAWAVAVAVLFYSERLTSPLYPPSKFVVTVAVLLGIGLVNLPILFFVRKRYPSVEQTKRRILALLAVSLPITILLMTLCTSYFDAVQFWGFDLNFKSYVHDFGAAFAYLTIVLGILEGFYLFNQWKATLLESEQLKQEQLQTQLESLKNQVNPHFLFNSLNSLSSLIEIDENKAKTFVEELAQVYRYLLQSNEHELTTLEKELEFIHAYTFLLKTRFSKGFNLDIRVSKDSKTRLIPPLTLQLLVENAVKHNVIAASKPLTVWIYDAISNENLEKTGRDTVRKDSFGEGGVYQLIVSNNLQKKQANVLSNRLGLQNIIKKYKLLGQSEVKVEQTDAEFKVVLPLIHHS